MNNQKKLYLILAFVIICLFAFIFVLIKIVKVNSECMQNPFMYGASKIIDEKGEGIYSVCSCDVGANKFYFDKFGIYKEHPMLNFIELD